MRRVWATAICAFLAFGTATALASVSDYSGQVSDGGTLLLRGAERAEGVARAMRCRAFDGRYRSLAEFRTRTTDVLFFGVVAVAALAVVAGDFMR